MFKKLMVLAVACGFSMSASAAFIQYDLKDVKFDDGTALTGFFVQNTDRGTIAFYALQGPGNIYMADQYSGVSSVNATLADGPFNFLLWSNEYQDFRSTLALSFGAGSTQGSFTVGGFEHTNWLRPSPGAGVTEWQRNIVSGSAGVGQIAPTLLASLEAAGAGNVPEPASLALLAAGAAALGGVRRRVKRS